MRRWFSSWNRPISWRWRPNDFDSRMPLTLSVSSVMEVMSAMVFCVLDETSRRARPTLTVSHRNNGINASDKRVSCTDRINIAINVLMMMTTFGQDVGGVSVTTFWTPPRRWPAATGSRRCASSVKNRRGMNCRWAYRELRRSCITRRPTRLAMYVWPMPMMLVMIGIAIIRPTYR